MLFNYNVLVVDDSKPILLVLESFLEKIGVLHIETCLSAKTALQKVQDKPDFFHLLFIDLNMPEMDGMELLRHLGEIRYPGGVVIESEMEPRIIRLASEVAKQYKILLIGNMAKPLTLSGVEQQLKRLANINERRFNKPATSKDVNIKEMLALNLVTPYYQPKIDSKTLQVVSLEVLARIVRSGETDALLPGQFIPLAEAEGVLDLLTFQLIEKAFADYRQLAEEFEHPVSLGINISPSQLNDERLPDKLDLMLLKHGIPIEKVIIEVTEENALKSTAQLETLNRLRIKGYGGALDDFGTGFTNLNQLLHLPFTEIKVDMSLIRHIDTDQFSQVIVNSLIELSDKLNIDIVAEGIERIEDFHYLTNLKHRLLLQGFFISRPKPKDSIIRWHHGWKKNFTDNR